MPAAGRLVWVTRAEPGASETAGRLRSLRREPLVAPLLTVRPLPLKEPDLNGFTALAFSSANGVRAFAALTPRRDLPVFAVGETTAAVARAHGFQVVGRADDGVAALARLIAGAPRTTDGRILHPTAREPAGDLVGRLAAAGVRATALAVYETIAASETPPPALSALKAGAVSTLLIHSPRAARALAALVQRERLTPALASVDLLGLSSACLAPLEACAFAARLAPQHPAEHALLALLRPEPTA